MSQLPEGGAAGAPQYYQWIFQWSFAATACTIVSGAIAERTRFEAYFFYSFFMAAWVYPIIVHSVWSVNGWANMNRANGPLLFQRGVIDFAGSGAVHMVGGEETVPGTLFSEPFWGGSLFFFHRKGKNSPLFLPLFFKKKNKNKNKKGFAAAAGALIVGPRIGRFLPDGTVVSMPGHNSSLFILGVMILWFGW